MFKGHLNKMWHSRGGSSQNCHQMSLTQGGGSVLKNVLLKILEQNFLVLSHFLGLQKNVDSAFHTLSQIKLFRLGLVSIGRKLQLWSLKMSRHTVWGGAWLTKYLNNSIFTYLLIPVKKKFLKILYLHFFKDFAFAEIYRDNFAGNSVKEIYRFTGKFSVKAQPYLQRIKALISPTFYEQLLRRYFCAK